MIYDITPLMIDPFNFAAAFKEVDNHLGLDQGPPCVKPITRWDVMRKSKLPELVLGSGYYAYCELQWYEKPHF